MSTEPQPTVEPIALAYAPVRRMRASAIWFVITAMSVVFQGWLALQVWPRVERARAGIAAVQTNPRVHGRELDAQAVRRVKAAEPYYVAIQLAFIVACAAVATASAWVFVTLARARTPDAVSMACRRYGAVKLLLTGLWMSCCVVAYEGDYELWVSLTRHSPIGSETRWIGYLVPLAWGLNVAWVFRKEGRWLQAQ